MKRPLNLQLAEILLVLVAIATFLPTLSFGFTYDDFYQILYNTVVANPQRTAQSVAAPWLEPTFPGDLYRPLTVFTYRIGYLLHGSKPFWEHLLNVLLHGICTLLTLKLFLRSLPRGVSFAAALLFAVHPLHVEAVANVSGRAELLACAFALSALLIVSSRSREGSGYWKPVLVGMLAFLAYCSKESALTVALFAPLFIAGESTSKRLIATSPLIVSACVYLALRSTVLGGLFAVSSPLDGFIAENPLATLPLHERILPALAILGHYLHHFLLPISLSADYSGSPLLFWEGLLSLQSVIHLSTLFLFMALLLCQRGQPSTKFGWMALLAFALTSNLLTPIGTIMADRLAYLPSVGLSAYFVALGATKLSSTRHRALACGLSLACLALLSSARTEVWRDNETLFRRTVIDNPSSPKAAFNLALEEFHRGKSTTRAKFWFLRTLELDPANVPAAEYLMNIAAIEGDLGRAGAIARAILKLQPENARILRALQKIDEASTGN